MPSSASVVFIESEGRERFPEWATEGAVVLQWSNERGIVNSVGERCHADRQGGYTSEDAFVSSLYLMGASAKLRFKEMCEWARPQHRELAAIGGRDKLPASSSLSRLLAAIPEEPVKELAPWLLMEAAEVAPVLRHPSVVTRDVTGGVWHMFDYDESKTALRQRGLPEGSNLPQGKRLARKLAAPGYGGRKRGDVYVCRGALQHVGSALWLGLWMGPGNGEHGPWYEEVVTVVVMACELADAQPERAVLRYDGAGGNVPFISTCQSAGIGYLVRLARYELLEQPEVARHIDKADWYQVPSSGSGPERQATDLGWVVLEPAATTRRTDGSRYDPVETRVVVSRYLDPNQHGAGVHKAGWRYELYACAWSEQSWPAPQVVSGYYGRSAEENRFAQEDRELGLDRIFSYEPGGQAFVTLVGLYLWNVRTVLGFQLECPPAEVPGQQYTAPEIAAPPDHSLLTLIESHGNSDAPGLDQPDATVDASPVRTDGERLAWQLLQERTAEAVAASDYQPASGWQWDGRRAELRCPQGVGLTPRYLGTLRNGTWNGLRFAPPASACRPCPRRPQCHRTEDPTHQLRVMVPLAPGVDTQELREALAATATIRRRMGQQARRSPTASSDPKPHAPERRRRPPHHGYLWNAPSPATAWGLLAMTFAVLLPAVLRHTFRRACRTVEVHAVVSRPAPPLRRTRCYAYSDAERQHRRKSWQEKSRWNALPKGASIRLRLVDAGALQPLLAPGGPPRRE